MINVDGVICGYYRPSLTGYDMNRSWIAPHRKRNVVEFSMIQILDRLVRSRPLIFFLDFHGHSAQCNAFVDGVYDPDVKFNELQGLFQMQMAKATPIFDEEGGRTFDLDEYPGTMMVALHHRYQIPFAYTLEISFGGVDIGPEAHTQLTPVSYRAIGASTLNAIAVMLLDQIPMNALIESYVPPIFHQVSEVDD